MMIEIAGSLLRRVHDTFDNEVKMFAKRFVIDEDCGGWTGYLARLCGIATDEDIANRREEEEEKYKDCYYARLGVQTLQRGWRGTAWEKYGDPAKTAKFGCDRYWEFGSASRSFRARLPKRTSWIPTAASTEGQPTSGSGHQSSTLTPSHPTVNTTTPDTSVLGGSPMVPVKKIEKEDGSIPQPSMMSSWQLTH